MEQLTQIINDLGYFPTLIIGLALLLILITNFINLVRGITVTVGALSLVFYFALADTSQKKAFDNYAKTVTEAVTKGKVTQNLKSMVNSNSKDIMKAIETYKKDLIKN